ncbi:MAG: glycosyltransferase [Phycisphaerales bacterium]|nr:MAG: glycosyltransferase [Phycisphaerales bacterium]
MTAIDALIFARFPQAGQVKTRLCPPVSPAEAAALHSACLIATLELVRSTDTLRPRVVVTPDEAVEAMASLIGDAGKAGRSRAVAPDPVAGPGADDTPSSRGRSILPRTADLGADGTPGSDLLETGGARDVPVDPQGAGDLGERLWRAVAAASARGSRGVILIGADSPTLPWPLLDEAAGLVRRGRNVLGPTEDGGYYLLGLSLGACSLTVERCTAPPPDAAALFTRIDWGTESVARQTRERARASGLELVELAPWYDIDRPEDLAWAWRDLADPAAQHRPAAARLAELLRPWGEPV